MKERKLGRIIILCAFFVIICCSKGIWFFSEKFIDSTNYENRKLASKPTITLDNYRSFFDEYTAYFNDNLQFRNTLITMNSFIDYYFFRTSSNPSVTIGKDSYLFYTRADDGNPLANYQGKDLYSEEELKALAKNCVAQRDYFSSHEKEFVIYIAPNKERVFSEYMPDKYGKPAENYRALQIYNYLKENTDIRVIYPYAELMAAKTKIQENIWYKTDSHWNNIGAYIGAKALFDELGVEFPDITDSSISIVRGENTSGDLASMLGLTQYFKDTDYEYTVKGYNDHNVQNLASDFSGALIYKAVGADSRKLYVIRDSFSTALAPYLGSQFNESYLRHKSTYSYEDLESQNPDIVVYETVERYADGLMNFSIK